jgi:hypothetical protein
VSQKKIESRQRDRFVGQILMANMLNPETKGKTDQPAEQHW